MMTTVDVESPSRSEENDDGGTDNDATASDDEAAGTDDETPKDEETMCPSLRLDHRLQRTLLQIEDEDQMKEAAADVQSLSQNLAKFMSDMCGWVPDPNVQYRRQSAEKQPPKAGGRTDSKLDVGISASRRLAHHRNNYGQSSQQTASNVDFEFKHFSNYKKYSEQYRRNHTCGGPLQKLTQSAFGGRPRTIYYAGDATAEAGMDVNNSCYSSQQPAARTGPSLGGAKFRGSRVAEKPNSSSQPIISYSDISVNSPRYNLLSDTSYRKNRSQYPSMEWSHHHDGGPGFNSHKSDVDRQATGTQQSGQWSVAMNEQTLAVYTSKPPGYTLSAPTCPASPPKPHLPYFPSQQPLKQPPVTASNHVNDPLPSGYSLDRSLGIQGGCSTGISRNPVPHRDFYSQLMHAAHCLSLAAKSPKDFDFELPRWPACTSHSEIKTSTSSPQHTSHQEKSPKSSSPMSSSHSNNVHRVQIKGRGMSASPTLTHQSSKSSSKSCKQQHASRKAASMYSLENPTAATTATYPTSANYKETHYITIEAPTCSPFDTKSNLHAKREADEVVNKATSYRISLKEKPVVANLKEKSSVDMVVDANRPLAVCEVAWF